MFSNNQEMIALPDAGAFVRKTGVPEEKKEIYF